MACGIFIPWPDIEPASTIFRKLQIHLSMQEMQVQSLGQKEPLERKMATHSCILAWRWTEEPGGLQTRGSQSQTLLNWTVTKSFTNIKPFNPHRTVIEQISKCFLICTAKWFSMFADYTPEEVTFPQHPLFKIFFFDVGHFLKFLLNLLQYCFCFMFCFVFEACGIFVS